MSIDGEEIMNDNTDQGIGSHSKSSGEQIHNLLKNAKESFRMGDYKKAKRETERLENDIEDVRWYQEKTFSQFEELKNRINYRERQGFEVKEAKEILQEARDALREMKYELTFDKIEEAWGVLERALFIPFPFLEKDVKFETVIKNEGDNIIFGLQINNRMPTPLGEVLLTFLTPAGFKDIPEKRLGEIGPDATRSIKEELEVKKDGGMNHLSELIRDDKIVLRSYLDCDYGNPLHSISVRNISDKILRDIEVRPFIPESLEAEEKKKKIDFLEPSEEASVTFNLYAKVPGKDMRIEEVEEYSEEEMIDIDYQGEPEFILNGNNYVLQGERLDDTYSKLSKHFSKERNSLIISQINIQEFEDDFGIDTDEVDFLWITDATLEEGTKIIPPKELHGELKYRVEEFINHHDRGMIFIDSLGKIKAENGFENTLDYIEELWENTTSSDFNILVYANPIVFSEAELQILEEKFRMYDIA